MKISKELRAKLSAEALSILSISAQTACLLRKGMEDLADALTALASEDDEAMELQEVIRDLACSVEDVEGELDEMNEAE